MQSVISKTGPKWLNNGMNRLVPTVIMMCILLATGSASAETRLPVRFGNAALWQPRPTYLPNPAGRPVVETSPESETLRVETPGKGMKFELPIWPVNSHGEPICS